MKKNNFFAYFFPFLLILNVFMLRADDTIRLASWDGFAKSSQEQFVNDKKIFMRTMFTMSPASANISKLNLAQSEVQYTELKQKFIRRLFIVLAYSGLKFTTVENGRDLVNWPYPMSSIFGHGGRIIFDIKTEANVSADQFYAFLLSGDPKGSTMIGHRRAAASHGLKLIDNWLEEKKSISLSGHHGINIAIGGVGHLDANGDVIAPGGKTYDKANFVMQEGMPAVIQTVKSKDFIGGRQHGHVYVYTATIKKGFTSKISRSGLLIGIENSEPGNKSMFGVAHTAKSGMVSQAANPSVSGGKKWSQMTDLTAGAPAEYGGRRVMINESADFQKLVTLSRKIIEADESRQFDFFNELMDKNGAAAKTFIDEAYRNLQSETRD